MPREIAAVVDELICRGNEVWLIGSRANPSILPPNDWDILAFGNSDLLNDFQRRPPVKDLDLLIVVDGDKFEGPWLRESDGATKAGQLSAWKWTRLNEGNATYKGTKPKAMGSFDVVTTLHNAKRITQTHAA